jgi:hypothetical protein
VHRRPITAVALLVVGLVSLGACSGGTVSAPPTAPSLATTTTSFSAEERQAVLELGLLQPTDVPGYAAMPVGSDRSLDVDTITDLGAQKACEKLATTIANFAGLTKTTSLAYQQGRYVVQNSVTAFEFPDMADKVVVQMNRADERECLSKAFTGAFERQINLIVSDGSQFNDVVVRHVNVGTVGDNRSALEIRLNVKRNGDLRAIYFTRVAVQVGPAIIDFSFRSDEHAFPSPDEVILPVEKRVNDCLNHITPCGI